MISESRSIRSRFLIGTILWIGLGVVVGGMLVSSLFRWNLVQGYHDELNVHIDELHALTQLDGKGQPFLLRRLSDPRYIPPGSGFYWQVSRDGYQDVRSPSLGNATLDPHFAISADLRMEWTNGPSGEMLEYAKLVAQPSGPPLQLLIATDKRLVDADMARFNGSLILALAAFSAILIAAGFLQVRYGLRPLDQLARSIADIRAGRASRMQGTFPSEISPLVKDLNGLIESGEASVSRSRLLAGNLAHGLRTPIAILLDEADGLRNAGNIAAGNAIMGEARTMLRQIDLHLARARNAAAQPIIGQASALQPVIERLVGAFTRLYNSRAISFQVTASEDVFIACDEVDLIEMLSNLLDNAGKWATSQCSIGWECRDGRVRIKISDDGPGLPIDQHENIFRSGARLDDLTPGNGLGLAISRGLARIYGGDISLDNESRQGLTAVIELPGRPSV